MKKIAALLFISGFIFTDIYILVSMLFSVVNWVRFSLAVASLVLFIILLNKALKLPNS